MSFQTGHTVFEKWLIKQLVIETETEELYGSILQAHDHMEVEDMLFVPSQCTETSHWAATCSKALWDTVWSERAGWDMADPPREPPAGFLWCAQSDLPTVRTADQRRDGICIALAFQLNLFVAFLCMTYIYF